MSINKASLAVGLFASMISISDMYADLPEVKAAFADAEVLSKGNLLTVSTGRVSREWRWTEKGLVTSSLRDLNSGDEWVEGPVTENADWKFPGLTEGQARLISLTATPSDDEGFTSDHLEVLAEMEYPSTGVKLKYAIWVYPKAPGIRTQVWLKGGKNIARSKQETKSDGVKFKVISGVSHVAPESAQEHKIAKLYQLSTLYAPKNIELKMEGMRHDRDYKVMVSWWDAGSGSRRIQSIQALSMDGESKVQVVKPVALPSWRDKKMPEIVSFDIPDSVRVGDAVNIKVIKEGGVNVCVSEVWVYESEGGKAAGALNLNGDPKRISELNSMAPDGYRLSSYMNCGGKAKKVNAKQNEASERRVDFLPVKQDRLTAFGYYNDTQHRHTEDHHMSRQEPMTGDSVDWASVLFAENNKGGIAWVKESHKCVNRSGVDTGAFKKDKAGLHNTGSGLSAEYLHPEEYRWCWATWTVLYSEASSDQRELAMKEFDRARFPVDPKRDVWVKANTWGSGNGGGDSMSRAAESEVLKEIDSVTDLGIDVLQIDDGWQKGRSNEADKKKNEWSTRDDWYPKGWSVVRDAAASKGLRLGLWTAARAELDDLKRNFDEGGFETWKYDFAHISNYDHLYSHWNKLRSFLLYTEHKARMAVDVTENAPRFGYFWARDFGCVWLSNRKPNTPANTIPQPTLMLRENRELAEYVNLNKFELPIQNFARVNRQKSDAHLYGHGYEVALGLMGIPTFFQSTYYYKGSDRDEVRDLLSIYKPVQHELYQSYVFAMGDEPNGAAWSGFQWVKPGSKTGYLLVFRERKNTEAARHVSIRFCEAGDKLKVTDLRTEKLSESVVSSDKKVALEIQSAADFVFLKYELLSHKDLTGAQKKN